MPARSASHFLRTYNGVNVFAQAAPITPGLNPTGVTLSNGVCIHIGLN